MAAGHVSENGPYFVDTELSFYNVNCVVIQTSRICI